ncbi:SIS domain-containing protein [Spiroplasma clarkii]|uniref:SIS domain-containing protein n=1 Tax=Spiroplasma clarkii TaxID=2139 RepID=UPI001649BD1F|nr:SIS domain-containing protein [Spiroplasma clarkii]
MGFAMTSSYSGMMLAAWGIVKLAQADFDIKKIDAELKNFSGLTNYLETEANKLSDLDFERIVYLGSGCNQAFAQESRLKLLELTQGQFPAFFDNTLAFRHGPKSILNEKTIVFMLVSASSYERKYDLDLIKELSQQKQIKKLIMLDALDENNLAKQGELVTLNGQLHEEIFIGLAYIYLLQIFAVNKSIQQGLNPDNPCPTGEVNRVVQGVVIYPYE